MSLEDQVELVTRNRGFSKPLSHDVERLGEFAHFVGRSHLEVGDALSGRQRPGCRDDLFQRPGHRPGKHGGKQHSGQSKDSSDQGRSSREGCLVLGKGGQ